ncbi:MAG: hypothetical protein JOZ96_07110 [Acidobacteria bacterium]|nr:hypothetical protein [Acidobacteriota bacterium]
MPEQATLTIHDVGSQIRATCLVGPPDEDPDEYVAVLTRDRASLATLIGSIKKAIPGETTSIWAGLKDPLAAPAAGLVTQRFKECMELTIEEGSKLYAELSDHGLGDILRRLDQMPDGSRLRVSTDCAFLPWEILYPEPFSSGTPERFRPAPAEPRKLWGYRFVTSYNLLETGQTNVKWGELRAAHRSGPPYVSVNLNTTIEDSFTNRPFHPIKHHLDFFTSRLGGAQSGEVNDSPDEIYEQLYAPEQQPTLLYLYCHGTNTNPYAPGNEELLEIDADVRIKPVNLSSSKGEYARAPVIFLNSCTSGQPSPLSFSSFHSAFRGKKAIGLIGTAIEMPATFGAAFGCELINRYLAGQQLGVAIYALRRELVERGIPLALFYSLQCPAELSAPAAAQPQAATPTQEATP